MEPRRLFCLATDAASSKVRSRIECLVKLFLKSIMADKDVAIEPLSLISRTERNTGVYEDGIRLTDATYEKDFSIGNCGNGFFRVWKVMEICYHLLGIGKQATQREIFYKILSYQSIYVNCQNQVNNAIQDAVAVLLCTRRSLGIVASSKGLVAGRLLIEEHGGDMIDCSNLGSSAHPITADLNLQQQFYSDARYILVIEKDAIFQRLVEERFFLKVPCIVMTAKGFPDLASRALLHRLHQEFPSLLIYAVVDCRFGYYLHIQVWEHQDGIGGSTLRTTNRTSRRYWKCLHSDRKLKLRHYTLMVTTSLPNLSPEKSFRGATSNWCLRNWRRFLVLNWFTFCFSLGNDLIVHSFLNGLTKARNPTTCILFCTQVNEVDAIQFQPFSAYQSSWSYFQACLKL